MTGGKTDATNAVRALEIELKLAIAPEHIAGLRRGTALKSLSQGAAPSRRKLRSLYFDTPDLALRQAGFALRIRRAGRSWIQTLKGGGNAFAGLHERLELEWRLRQPALDLNALASAPAIDDDLRAFFSNHGAALAPIFSTVFTRSAWPLTLPDGSWAELALDIGEIRTTERTEAISEVEIELRQGGQPQALYEAALALLAQVPLVPEPASKAERGYALFTQAPAAPVKAVSVALLADMPAGAAFEAMLRAALDQIQRNRAGWLLNGGPEYLHQMRIGMRRARSALALFGEVISAELRAPVSARLRELDQALGPARDWDVFVLESLPPIVDHMSSTQALQRLPAIAAQRRAACGAQAGAMLASGEYARAILDIALWLARRPWQDNPLAAHPTLDHAHDVLEQRWQALLKAGKRLRRLSAPERHALRIRCKKLRYAAEFFAALFPKKRTETFRATLIALQESLGATTDAATAARLVKTLIDTTTDPLVIEESGIIIGWTSHADEAAQRRLRRTWIRVRNAKRFW